MAFASKCSAFVLMLLILSPCSAQDEISAKQKRLRRFLDDTCNGFEITTNTDKSLTTGKVVFRWDNPDRGSTDGCTALWYDKKKRPIAIASIFPIADKLHHDFDVLDRRDGAVGKLNGKEFWRTPKNSRLQFSSIPKGPKPASTERGRRVQLKLLAKQFSVELLGWRNDKRDHESLRMLTTPVHRYTSDDPKSDVLSGAVFLFVQGVDPEAALVLEVHRHKGELRWEFALVGQTSGALRAEYSKAVIWKKDRNEVEPSHGYIAKLIPRN